MRVFAPSSRLVGAVIALACSSALSGCGGGSDQLGSFGMPIEGGGQGAAIPVSDQFDVNDARELQARISSAAFHKALEKYSCGDLTPEFRFYVTLYEATPLSSRRVGIDYLPALDLAGQQRCLHFGLAYLLGKAVAEIDPTRTFSRTYRKPTGQTFEARTERTTREPHCDCDQRAAGGEWVTFPGPDEDEAAQFLGAKKE